MTARDEFLKGNIIRKYNQTLLMINYLLSYDNLSARDYKRIYIRSRLFRAIMERFYSERFYSDPILFESEVDDAYMACARDCRLLGLDMESIFSQN